MSFKYEVTLWLRRADSGGGPAPIGGIRGPGPGPVAHRRRTRAFDPSGSRGARVGRHDADGADDPREPHRAPESGVPRVAGPREGRPRPRRTSRRAPRTVESRTPGRRRVRRDAPLDPGDVPGRPGGAPGPRCLGAIPPAPTRLGPESENGAGRIYDDTRRVPWQSGRRPHPGRHPRVNDRERSRAVLARPGSLGAADWLRSARRIGFARRRGIGFARRRRLARSAPAWGHGADIPERSSALLARPGSSERPGPT